MSYTILALIPALAEQIVEGMDIEALTRELQARSRARQIERPPSSVASSNDVVLHVDQELQETRSDAGSVEDQRDMVSSLTSWIEASSSYVVATELSSSPPGHHLLATSSESVMEVQSSPGVLTNDSGDDSSVADSGLVRFSLLYDLN